MNIKSSHKAQIVRKKINKFITMNDNNNVVPAKRTSSRTPKPSIKTASSNKNVYDDDHGASVDAQKKNPPKKKARKAPSTTTTTTSGKKKSGKALPSSKGKKQSNAGAKATANNAGAALPVAGEDIFGVGGHRWQGVGMTYPASHPELDIIGRTTEMDECFLPARAMEKMMTENATLRETLKNDPIETWREMLTEKDREMLRKMLPENVRMDESLVENLVSDLLGGKTFHFDNPAERVWNQIRNGERHPHFARAKRIRREIQKRNSFLILRKKHDEVVDNLDQMRKLWMRLDEEVGMKERRKLWEEYLEVKAQRRKNLVNARKKNANLAKQMKLQKMMGADATGTPPREGSVSALGGADGESELTQDA
jgi:hypothetical protein